MRRYQAFDPPEYVDWTADPDLVRDFVDTVSSHPERAAVIRGMSADALLDLYRGMVRFRLHDIALQRWVRQGVISKAWLGTGEEAVTIGAVHALRRGDGEGGRGDGDRGKSHGDRGEGGRGEADRGEGDGDRGIGHGPGGWKGDVVGPMIRNAGACHEMGMSVADMLRGYLGTEDAPTRGRDLHIGDPSRGIIAPISPVGALCGVMNGYALAFRHRGEDRVALTWIGDGATKHGEVHEALNFAAVMKLPVVFVLQNNQVALGTRLDQHHKCDGFVGWARGYGMDCHAVDGNNVLDMHAAAVLAVRTCREGRGPVAIAAETFRMGGHATHDVAEARRTFPSELFAEWGRRDPIGLYEEALLAMPAEQTDGVTREQLAEIEAEVEAEVEEAAEAALQSRERAAAVPSDEEAMVYG